MRPDVFPVLASLTEVGARAEIARAEGRGGIPSLEFGDDLAVVLVIKESASQTWVDEATAATLAPDAFPRAVENLRACTKQPLRLTRTSSPKVGVWVAGADDGLGSGRHLAVQLVIAAEAKGVAALTRDWLMWTPAGWIARET